MKKIITAFALLPLLGAPSFSAPLSARGDQARINQAVQAYAARVEADRQKDADLRIANAADPLQNDPASPVIGRADAPVVIVEFFDYACSYCKAAEPRLEAALRANKDTRLVLKEFPILTPQSMIAARVSLAAAKQGKYTRFHQALMNYRGQLDADAILQTARDSGLNMTRMKKDMESADVTGEIIANFNLARALRIFQTPGFIAGGHMLSSKSASIDFPKVIALARLP